MKKVILAILFGLCFGGFAHAGDPMDCYDSYVYLDISTAQRIQLCAGASSEAPMKCYSDCMSSAPLVGCAELCAGATSDAPMACVDKAQYRNLTKSQTIQLCKTTR
jgi:hypothetical protein